MDNIHQIRKHFAITSCSDVQEICQPLSEVGIPLFVYIRIYNDKKRILLANNPVWNENYLEKLYKRIYIDNHQFEAAVTQSLLLLPQMFPSNVAFKDAREIFGFKYAYLVTSLQQNYKELCYFVMNNNDPHVFNTFYTNIDVLLRFKNYFNERAQKLIQIAEKDKLDFVFENKLTTTNSGELNSRFHMLRKQLQKYQTTNHIYLTNQELECMRWLIIGKTAEEIGLILGISKRTVEKYIENMKIKYNCTKVTQLIYKLAKANLDIYL